MAGSIDEAFSTINMKELLSRIQLLETKVSLCVQNQPLLFQEVSICKLRKEYYDGRLAELNKRIDRIGTTASCLCPCRAPVPVTTTTTSTPKDLNVSEQHASFPTVVVRPQQASEMNMNAEGEEGNENEAEINNFLPEETEIFNPSEMTSSSAFTGRLEGAHHESHRAHAVVPELRRLIKRKIERKRRIGNQTEAPTVPPPAAQAQASSSSKTRVTQVCPKCGKCFRRIAHTLQHIRNVHNVSKSKFQCEFCGESYRQWEKLRTHQRKVHGQVSEVTHKTWAKATPCPEGCGLHFVGVGDLLLHMDECQSQNKMGNTHTSHNDLDTHRQSRGMPNGETRN